MIHSSARVVRLGTSLYLVAIAWMVVTASLTWPISAQRIGVQSVILDTDIGDDIDDAYALTLLATLSPQKVLGVTTVSGPTEQRAELAAKLLMVAGLPEIPVYAGHKSDQPMSRQYEWARGFRSANLKELPAIEFLHRQIQQAPGEITIIAIGPLTNLADLFQRYPETKGQIKHIFIMGGGLRVGYDNKPPAVPEYNIKSDPVSARTVFASGVPLTMAGLDVTSMMQFDEERQKQLFAIGTPATSALAALTNLWGNHIPTLFDPMAVAYALGYRFADEERQHVVIDDNGTTRISDGIPNVTVLLNPRREAFLDWYTTAHFQKH